MYRLFSYWLLATLTLAIPGFHSELVGQSSFSQPSVSSPLANAAFTDPIEALEDDRPDVFEEERKMVVLDVRILGNESISSDKIFSRLKTRPDRYFDPDLVHADTREIMAMKSFRNVKTFTQKQDDGIIVTFQVYERPIIREVQYIGNRELTDRALTKQTGLKDGDPLDIYSVRMAKNRIEEYYSSKGYPDTEVEILEGTDPQDRKVVFVINEHEKQRIWSVDFVGNQIASDDRLRKAVIKAKPGFMKYFFKGQVVATEINADQKRIEAYYKGLGYFSVRVQSELEYDDSRTWLTIRWVIDEGPRYVIEKIGFAGNAKYSSEELAAILNLHKGEFFVGDKLAIDINTLRDLYGSEGYVFANIQAEPSFHDEPGKLDVIYRIDEGEQYRVGRINVHIGGEYGFTKQNVVLNRISLRPGDVIDIRKIRNSERRLSASGLFVANPGEGAVPSLEVKVPDPSTLEQMARRRESAASGSTFRGQSPDYGSQQSYPNALVPQR